MEGKIVISIEDYNELIRQSERYINLVTLLYSGATLSYMPGELNLNTSGATQYLKAVDYTGYSYTLKGLEAEKKRKEEENVPVRHEPAGTPAD